MRAIFLTEKPKDLARVYEESLMARLCEKTGGEMTVFDKEAVMKQPDRFRDTRFIFSTWGMPVFTEEEIRSVFPSLECIFYGAGTVQMFARPFLHCGVKVISAWMANGIPVAEYVLAQILLANKGFFLSAQQMSAGEAKLAKQTAMNYPGNYGASVGIIGAGAVGAEVCRLLKPFHMRVLACSLDLTEERAAELGVEISDIETIFRTCQVVSNHLPNIPTTQGILKREHFASMVPYGVFLNTGRGAQVVEEDLAAVLEERPDLTAVLDVTKPEPPLPDSPFYRLTNCILTPHIAGSSGDEVHRMAQWMEEEYDRYCAGKPCRYEVTEKMLETMA